MNTEKNPATIGIEMKNEIKELWCEALRSGAYAKTTGVLKNEEGWCCLGVLCELHRRFSHVPAKWAPEDHSRNYYAGEFELLPPEVREWAGLKDHDPTDTLDRRLSALNDGTSGYHNHSLSEIADIIDGGGPSIAPFNRPLL